ncbi:MAG: hypothetical protein QW051_02690 [Candidatus Aenigmatarchaeota archaeon]
MHKLTFGILTKNKIIFLKILIIIFVFHFCFISLARAEVEIPLYYLQSAGEAWEPTSLEFKQEWINGLFKYAQAGEILLHYWNPLFGPKDYQEWIDIAHQNGLKVVLVFDPRVYLHHSQHTIGGVPIEYRRVRLNTDGTFTRVNELAEGEIDLIDYANPEAVNYRAQQLYDILSRLHDLDYFKTGEETLLAGRFSHTEFPYYEVATYSDAALYNFRDYLVKKYGEQYRNAKFPVDRQIKNIPPESQYKIEYVDPNNDPSGIWEKWWEWRFKIYANYIHKLAESAYLANKNNPSFKGFIYFQHNRLVYEVSGFRSFGVRLEDIALSPYVDILISETGADFWNYTEAEKGAQVFKDISSRYGKKFGLFIQLWSFGISPNGVPGGRHVSFRDIGIQFERIRRYNPYMVAEYPAAVLRELKDNSYYGTIFPPWDKDAHNSAMIEYWNSQVFGTTPITGVNYLSLYYLYSVNDDVLRRDFSRFKKDGIKVISISLPWYRLEGNTRGSYDGIYPDGSYYGKRFLDNVKRVINIAKEYDLKVLLPFIHFGQKSGVHPTM